MEGDVDAGEFVEVIEEGWIEREAEVGELAQRRRVFGIAGGEHSGSGCGGLGEGLSSVQNGDAQAAAVEFESEREADDAASSDADVGTMHKTSLVRSRKSMVRGVEV